MVVRTSLYPKSSWALRVSKPFSSKWVANECLNVWQVTAFGRSCLVLPKPRLAALTIRPCDGDLVHLSLGCANDFLEGIHTAPPPVRRTSMLSSGGRAENRSATRNQNRGRRLLQQLVPPELRNARLLPDATLQILQSTIQPNQRRSMSNTWYGFHAILEAHPAVKRSNHRLESSQCLTKVRWPLLPL